MTTEQQKEIAGLTDFIKEMEELGEVKLEAERVRYSYGESDKWENGLVFKLGNKQVTFPHMIRFFSTSAMQKEKDLLTSAIKAFTVPQIVNAKNRIADILGINSTREPAIIKTDSEF